MKYSWKVFLWENGHKSTELTQYLTFPLFIEDRLDEQLDTGEIILDLMPIESKNAFPPKTKIRIERYYEGNFNKKWDLVVSHDDVEEYVGEPKICCHRINLIEASVIAQGMHVDNISLTYRLQDVNLSYITYNSNSIKCEDAIDGINYSNDGWKEPIHPQNLTQFTYGGKEGYKNSFITSYNYVWKNFRSNENKGNIPYVGELLMYYDALESHEITFIPPTLMWQGCPNGNRFEDLYEVPIRVEIYRTETVKGRPIDGTRELVSTKFFESKKTGSADSCVHTIITDGSFRINDSDQVAFYKTIRKIDYERGGNGGFSSYFKTDLGMRDVVGFTSKYRDNEITITTPKLDIDDINNYRGFIYEIECYEENYSTLPIYYEYNILCGAMQMDSYGIQFIDEKREYTGSNKLYFKSKFYVQNNVTENLPFLINGVEYSCYDLLRKTLLTIDTQVIDNNILGIDDIQYFIIVDDEWVQKLKTTPVYETVFEQKNLWEVLLQIGHYLHAIPYLEFSEDGTDRFILKFKQLGGTALNDDTNTKITIFNSKNLSDYFSEYDSYISNLFSPQNDIEEWLTTKTEDSSYLISNNTAVLKTKYNISEIEEFDIIYNGQQKSAIKFIFEESIYNLLTSDYRISPGKGDSLYYQLGSNVIKGLTYSPPQRDNVSYRALTTIVATLFNKVERGQLKYNDLIFHIKYKTQDSVRMTQTRPDLENFMKNSSYEKYPHHEQFYGQQEKIIDSEKMSLNMYGRLIQLGNNIWQKQEYVNNLQDEKESGQLVRIDSEPYYITVVENEFYPDAIFQKSTYSKNFNQLSQIVTIPSEPRFYEVSERSKIRREIRMIEFLKISTIKESELHDREPKFLTCSESSENRWTNLIKNLIFYKTNKLPNYALTHFTCDKKRDHTDADNNPIDNEKMFPSSEVIRVDDENGNFVRPVEASDHIDVIVPVLHYPIYNGIVFEWDMEDNFKAGDFVNTEVKEDGNVSLADDAYFEQTSFRYCDIKGGAELFNFNLFNKQNFSQDEIRALPKAVITPSEEECFAIVKDNQLIALEKDNREELSFNFQVNLLHKSDISGNDFVTFPNLFGDKKGDLRCAIINKEISIFDSSISYNNVLVKDMSFNLIDEVKDNKVVGLRIEFDLSESIDLGEIKAIVFYQDSTNEIVLYLAKNVSNLPNNEKLQSWFIYPVFTE